MKLPAPCPPAVCQCLWGQLGRAILSPVPTSQLQGDHFISLFEMPWQVQFRCCSCRDQGPSGVVRVWEAEERTRTGHSAVLGPES